MMDIWKSLKDIFSVNQRKVYISNLVFQLHYKVTVVILLIFSILVTSKQYLGDPIDCISSPDVKSIAEKYCWIHSTFTRGRQNDEGRWSYEPVEDSEVQPGIRPAVEGDKLIFHSYYQWVWSVLFLQAGLFYFPHWLWKSMEGGRIKTLVSDLNLQVIEDEKVCKHKEAILRYFTPNQGFHTMYAWKHILCEFLNFVNVCFQIYTTDEFLNNDFTSYGLNIFGLTQTRPYFRYDSLAKVFPTVTACRIATGGPAFGTVEHDLLCVLSINILNEKIFIFIWFWFIILATLSTLNLIFRVLTLCIPPMRNYLLLRNVRKSLLDDDGFELKFSYGDWFLLEKLGQNMNPIIFGELLRDLAERNSPNYDSTRKPLLHVNGGGSDELVVKL